MSGEESGDITETARMPLLPCGPCAECGNVEMDGNVTVGATAPLPIFVLSRVFPHTHSQQAAETEKTHHLQ